MKALWSWLQELVPAAPEAAAGAQALSLAGQAVEQVTGLEGGDSLLELDLTSNRPDCLSHVGLARELAAILDAPLQLPAGKRLERQAAGERVRILAPEGCGRYCALALEKVRIEASAEAIARRLEALGQRSINNIADWTNYVLWELGQPTHAFDAERLRGGRIEVRWARAGERLRTLDGVERDLATQDLVIADAERAVALAGVMGGEETAIGSGTRRVLLESAWFDPRTIRRTARRHGLHTEASHRFERGADPEAAVAAAERFAALAAGAAETGSEGLLVAAGTLPQAASMRLRPERIRRVLGQELGAPECERILRALGCQAGAGGVWTPPSWRPDLGREIDLIEELARIHGYERFPSRLPAFVGFVEVQPEARLQEQVRQQLRGRGFAEAISLVFANEAEGRQFAPERKPVRVLNPLSEAAAILRTSSYPAMLELLAYNAHRGRTARLYEIGKRYELDAETGTPREQALLTMGSSGEGDDYRQFRGEVEAVLAIFAHPELASREVEVQGLSPAVSLGEWAVWGRLDADEAKRRKLPPDTWVAEVALERCLGVGPRIIAYEPPPRYPAVERDFSFLFADAVSWTQVEQTLRAPAIPCLEGLEAAEVFRSPALGEGNYSLLVRVRFQSRERTLREEEVQGWAEEIVRRLQGLGGEQRK